MFSVLAIFSILENRTNFLSSESVRSAAQTRCRHVCRLLRSAQHLRRFRSCLGSTPTPSLAYRLLDLPRYTSRSHPMPNSASSAMPLPSLLPPPSSTFILPTPTISIPLSQSITYGFSSKAAAKRRACSSCPRPLSVGGSIPLSTGPHGDLRQTISKRPTLLSHDAHANARTRHPLRFPPLTVVSTSAPDVSQPPPASASRRNTVGRDAYLRRQRRKGKAQALVQCDPSPTALPASLTTPPPPPPLASPIPPLTAETPDQATPPS